MAILDQLEKEGRGNELGKIFQLTDKTEKDLAPMLLKTLKRKAVSDAEVEAKKVTDSIKGLIFKLVQNCFQTLQTRLQSGVDPLVTHLDW